MYYTRYCRSILFTSALHGSRFSRAHRSGADISLVDLEDSVAQQDKEQARRAIAEFFPPPNERIVKLAVRVNAISDSDGFADLLALRSLPYRPDIIMAPKVESPRDIEIVLNVLGDEFAQVDVIAVIETVRGVQNAAAIAMASPAMKALIFGSADFSMAVNSTMDWEALYPWRAQIMLAARGAGIHAVDTATFDIADTELLAREARRTRDMGFSGKAAIHPGQVAIINQVFSPDLAALQHARRIVTEAEANKGNICAVDGMMVGVPIVEAARRTLAQFADANGTGV
ncbi:MAG: HpcH/HpaI aldolase/citrate lyase family protein [Micromonosporaceae bacterium]